MLKQKLKLSLIFFILAFVLICPTANAYNAQYTPPPAEQEKAPASKEKATPEAPKKTPAIKPKINLPIPTLKGFSDIEIEEGKTADIPWLAEYIVAIYQYAIIIGSILAVLALLGGGILYLTAGGLPNNIKKAQKMMAGSITGLAILMSSYLILYIVNPKLVDLKAVKTEIVESAEFLPEAIEYNTGVGIGTPPSGVEKQKSIPTAKNNCGKMPFQGSGMGSTEYADITNCYYTRTRSLTDISKIIIHEGGTETLKTVKYWKSGIDAGGSTVGSHYMINRDGSLYQLVDERRIPYHAPGFSEISIGIDLAITVPSNVSSKECLKCKKNGNCKSYTGKKVTMKKTTKDQAIKDCYIYYTPQQYNTLGPLVASITARTGVSYDNEHIRFHCDSAANHVDPRNFIHSKLGLTVYPNPPKKDKCFFSVRYDQDFKKYLEELWGK